MRIDGNTFLVTGANSGLGAACAAELVRRGGNVVRVDREPASEAIVAEDVATRAGAARQLFLTADVTDASTIQTAIDQGRARFGELHGVINCAGILRAARVLGRSGPHDLQLFEQVINVNLIGTFNVIRLVAAAMSTNAPQQDGERGVIVNTSSVAAYEGQIGQAAYSASKAAVAGMTLPLARELAQHGIRAVAIAPGVFETAMMGAVDDALRASLSAQTPFPARLGQPDEFALLVCHVLENRMLNGCVLRLDGAMRMGAK